MMFEGEQKLEKSPLPVFVSSPQMEQTRKVCGVKILSRKYNKLV